MRGAMELSPGQMARLLVLLRRLQVIFVVADLLFAGVLLAMGPLPWPAWVAIFSVIALPLWLAAVGEWAVRRRIRGLR